MILAFFAMLAYIFLSCPIDYVIQEDECAQANVHRDPHRPRDELVLLSVRKLVMLEECVNHVDVHKHMDHPHPDMLGVYSPLGVIKVSQEHEL